VKGAGWLAVGMGALGGEGRPAAVLESCFCVLLARCEVLLAGAVREEVCCTSARNREKKKGREKGKKKKEEKKVGEIFKLENFWG
jgi:hypothetical protein